MRLGFLLCTATPEASCSVRCGSPERAQCTVSSEINPSQSLTYFPGPAKKKEFLWFANSFFLVRDPFPPFRSGRTREKKDFRSNRNRPFKTSPCPVQTPFSGAFPFRSKPAGLAKRYPDPAKEPLGGKCPFEREKGLLLGKKKVGESLLPGALYWVLVPRQTPCVRVRYFHAPCPRPRALAGGFSDDSFASPQGAQPAPLASAGVSPHTVRPANWNSETKRSPTSNPFAITKKSSRYSDPPCCSCECKNRKAFPNQNVFTIC